MLIRLGHSPDPDDAFMFWGLAEGEVDPRGFEFEHVLADIQTLNEWALEGRLEVTAISLHAYPHVQDRYVLLPHGASMGSGYGPIVVAREPLDRGRAARGRDRGARADDDGVPHAAAAPRRLPLARGAVRPDPGRGRVRHGRRGPAHPRGAAHLRRRRAAEGASTSASGGSRRRVCRCRSARTSRGATSGEERCASSPTCSPSRSGRASTTASEALEYALQFGRGLDDELADRFVGMYVNELTEDYGEEGRRAVHELLRRGEEIGAFTRARRVEFVG